MKTAISVSDEVFTLSEKLAKKLKVSRSSVFAMGVKKLSEDLDKKAMIERINRVCAEVDTSVDPALKAYTFRKLSEME